MVLDDDLRQKLEEQLELLAERRKQETTNEDLAKLTEQMVCIVSLLESEP